MAQQRESAFVYRKSLETPPAIWGSCSHCGALADEFCTRCRPLGAFWCNACCHEYHGYWKKRGAARVFVPVKWTSIFHQADQRLARKSEKRAHLDNHKKEEHYRSHHHELNATEIDLLECHEEETQPSVTSPTPTTRSSAKRRTARVATAGSVATATCPDGSSKSVTSVVTSVLIARNGMRRTPLSCMLGKSTNSKW